MQQNNTNSTKNSNTAMILNQEFLPINSICTWGFFTKFPLLFSLALYANAPTDANADLNNTKEGVFIPFSLSKAKLSNLNLMVLSTCTKSNLSALNLISASAVQGRELICSRSISVYKYA
jgi:hypothetical protein